MKLHEFKNIVDHCNNSLYENEEEKVVIAIKRPWSTVGGSPFVEVKSASSGFDWDQGKFFIYPEQNLYLGEDTSAEKVSELSKKLERIRYELWTTKQEVKRLKKKLGDHENEK